VGHDRSTILSQDVATLFRYNFFILFLQISAEHVLSPSFHLNPVANLPLCAIHRPSLPPHSSRVGCVNSGEATTPPRLACRLT
jgi:hypothetical protein